MRIMLVDDDKNGLRALTRVVASSFDTTTVIESYTSSTLACDKLRQAAFDVIISDYRMPIVDGVTLLAKAKQMQPCCIRLMLSGYCDKESLYGAINIAHVQRFIEKPYDPETLKSIIEGALSDYAETTRIGHLLNEEPQI